MDGLQTFTDTLRNPSRKYPDRSDARFREHTLFPDIRPGFTIAPGSSVFTIGSCFAREVEEELDRQGMAVPTLGFAAPPEEAPGRSNRILNQYNPGTMLQCIETRSGATDTRGLYDIPLRGVLDCLLSTGARPVPRARALERRRQIQELYRAGLEQSDTVVITLGLIEAWYDREQELYLNEVPPKRMMKTHPGRFEFRRLGVEESRALVFRLIEALQADRPRRIVLTVSPVPLQVTFGGGDAVVANSYSKSVLRVVAELACTHFADVDYFPSYEIVTTMGLRALGEDNVHVRPVVVNWVIGHMRDAYLQG